MMDEFLELLEMMQDELQEWKSMPDSPAPSLPPPSPGPRSGRPCPLSLLPDVKCADEVIDLSAMRKRKSAPPRELRAGPSPERDEVGPTAKRPRREGSAEESEAEKEEGQRQSVPGPRPVN
jgi:hypothetical protein